jgi:hypothetical protein
MSDPVDPFAPVPEPAPQAAPPPAASPAPSTISIPAWSSLDAGARNVVVASLGAAAVLVVGGLLGAWPSGDFLVIALLAALIVAGATWMGRSMPASISRAAPSEVLASLASAVVAVLGIWRLIELVFDFDQLDEVGGAVGAGLIVALAIVGGALVFLADQRAPATAAAVRSGDRSVQLALIGLALVLLGWAINLASYWTMRQATPTLALLTVAALTIELAGRGLPLLAAWVGIVLAGLGALLALDLWGQLTRLGETRLELGLTDYLPFLIYVVGLVLILAAGARVVMSTRVGLPPGPAAPPAPPPTS